jgi:hypothetical protein
MIKCCIFSGWETTSELSSLVDSSDSSGSMRGVLKKTENKPIIEPFWVDDWVDYVSKKL